MESLFPITSPPSKANVNVERPYECEICSKRFSHKKNLQVHIRDVHIELRAHPCSVCGKIFMDSIMFQHHMLTHTGKPVRECGVCHKLFSRTTTLRNHMKLHLRNEKYRCPECGKPNGTKFDFDCHMRTHTGERPYECLLCNPPKGFATNSSLKRHCRTHSGDQPHECQACKKTFARKDQYRRHLKKHLAVHCQGCGKFFEKYSLYADHQSLCPGFGNESDFDVGTPSNLNLVSEIATGDVHAPSDATISSALQLALGNIPNTSPGAVFDIEEDLGPSNLQIQGDNTVENYQGILDIVVEGNLEIAEEEETEVFNIIIESDELDQRERNDDDDIDAESFSFVEKGKSLVIVEQGEID